MMDMVLYRTVVVDSIRFYVTWRRVSHFWLLLLNRYGHESMKLNSLYVPIVYYVILHFKGESQKRTTRL